MSSIVRMICVWNVASLRGFLLFGTSVLMAEPLLKMTRHDAETRLQIFPSQPLAIGLLEALEVSSGRCVKTLHAGTFSSGQVVLLGNKSGLNPGRYRIRYREGIRLETAGELRLPGKESWANPTDLALTEKAVYVLDNGRTGKATSDANIAPANATAETRGTCIHKFNRDGTPGADFGDRGRMTLREGPSAARSLAVDRAGQIYVPLDHAVRVYDGTAEKPIYAVGGFNPVAAENHYGPKGKNTQEVGSAALGRGSRIYLGILAHYTIRVYDRTREKFEGFLYTLSAQNAISGSNDRCLISDGEGSLYFTHTSGQLQKLVDTGKELKIGCVSHVEPKLYHPVGPSASAGLIWVAAHGPGGGPFWDSGGGGEVALFWDHDENLTLVERFGAPGKSADQLEFLNPSATVMNADHTELWVAEDGMPNEEGPPGNARVRRFRIAAAQQEEVSFQWKGGENPGR